MVLGLKQLKLAAGVLAGLAKAGDQAGIAAAIDLALKATDFGETLRNQDPVAVALRDVSAKLEEVTRKALSGEFGADWEHKPDLVATLAALPDVLESYAPDTDSIFAQNLDPERIARSATDAAEAAHDDLFGRDTIGERLLFAVIRQTYAVALANKDFALQMILRGQGETLSRLDETAAQISRLTSDLVQNTPSISYIHVGLAAFQGTQAVLDGLSGPLYGCHTASDKLDAFISQYDRGVFLIAAPAGMGKSALLAAWSGIISGPSITVVRHFFSARWPEGSTRASLVRSLTGQIASMLGPHVLGEGAPGDTNDLADRLVRCLQQDRPSGAKLIVVLDSLDEAAEPIMPFVAGPLGRGCYLILSVRAEIGEQPPVIRRWRELANTRACRFEETTLGPLGRVDIHMWLSTESQLLIGEHDPVVEQVWRASEGVPLFVKFLVPEAVDWLRRRRSDRWAEDKFPDSFVEYAQTSLDDLRALGGEKQSVWSMQIERLFALLTVVRGPIGGRDIAALIDDFALGTSFLDTRVERWFNIRRIGREHYASFAHQRLADVFRHVLSEHIIEGMRKRLLDYCRRYWRAQSSPDKSAYALEFLPAHIVDLCDVGEAAALLCLSDFILDRLTLSDPERLIALTVSETLALRQALSSAGGELDWWCGLWSMFESPLRKLAEQKQFGRTDAALAMKQLLLDQLGAQSSTKIKSDFYLERLVGLERPVRLSRSLLFRSVDEAHSWGMKGVLAIGDRLVSWGYDGAIRFWSATGERLPGGNDQAHSGVVDEILFVGDRLISWGEDDAIRFWSSTGERLADGIENAHEEYVSGVVPVGDRLVSWGGSAIRFWSTTGKRLPGGDDQAHTEYVDGVLAVGDRLISWGREGGIRFWSLTGERLQGGVEHAHEDYISGVVPVGEGLVSWGDESGTIRFWSAEGERLASAGEHAPMENVDGVLAVGGRLVSWGQDGAIRFWSATGERLPGGDEQAHLGFVGGILVVGDRLISWGGDGAIRFWSLTGERLVDGIEHAHAEAIDGVCAIGDRLASWSRGGIRLWSAAGERFPGGDDNAHSGGVEGVLEVAGRLVSWCSNGAIRLWSEARERSPAVQDYKIAGLLTFADSLSKDERLVSWGYDRSIRFWSPVGELLPGSVEHAHAGAIDGVLAVGDRLVSWGGDGAIRFWSAAGERLPGGHDQAHTGITGVRHLCADRDRLISWDNDGAIRFWSLMGEPLLGGVNYAHDKYVDGVLAVGDRLVSWGGDGAVRFWSGTGKRLPGGSENAHESYVSGVLAVGDRLVSWGGDGAIRFWSETGRRLRIHRMAHTGGVTSGVRGMAVVGDRLTSWGEGGIRFWSLTGEPLQGGAEDAHSGSVLGVIALGERLVSWGADGAIRFWSAAGESLAGGSENAHADLKGVLVTGDRLLSWGGDRIVKFWSKFGEPLASWIQPSVHAVPIVLLTGKLFLFHREGPREVKVQF